MNTGYINNGERANLLSGLRTASSPRMNQHQQAQLQQQQQEQQLIQQYLYQQQQQQQQQAMMFAVNPNHAQIFAQQQLQIELQLKQIQMTNLALQEQLLAQHQQALAAQQQQQQQQQQLKNDLPQPPARANSGGYRSASASPVVTQGNWVQQQLEENAKDGAQQARWGALRNLQQASRKRDNTSPTSALPTGTASASATASTPSARDWQSERMRFSSPPITGAPPLSIHETPLTPNRAQASAATLNTNNDATTYHGHGRNDSTVSDASIQSIEFSPNKGPTLVLSKPGDEFPDEDDDASSATSTVSDDAVVSPSGDPLSPSVEASLRSSYLNKGRTDSESSETKRSKRHTVILSGALPRVKTPTLAEKQNEGQVVKKAGSQDSLSSTSSASSAGPVSPVDSEQSESSSSFNSTNTRATSLSSRSPTVSKSIETEFKDKVSLLKGTEGQQRSVSTPLTGAALNPSATSFNPAAASFVPGGKQQSAVSASRADSPSSANFAVPSATQTSSKDYPSSLSLKSTPGVSASSAVATPPSMRFFTAPPSSASSSSYAGTPNSVSNTSSIQATATRQPKGPANEADFASKNFAGMARRRAVAGLKVAASSANGRTSPMSSPVIGSFPSTAASFTMSPPLGSVVHQQGAMPSPTQASFAAFGQELASRALKRRSQQMQLTAQQQQGLANPGLGMF